MPILRSFYVKNELCCRVDWSRVKKDIFFEKQVLFLLTRTLVGDLFFRLK